MDDALWRTHPPRAGAVVTRAAAQADPKKRVVITGMGIASVFGNDIDTYYNNLLEGKSGITTIDRCGAAGAPALARSPGLERGWG